MRRLCLLLLAILCIAPVSLASCAKTEKPEAGAPSSQSREIHRDYRKGPCVVRLKADKKTMTIAESLVLTIEAEVENGWEAELPGFGQKLGEFGIRDYRQDPPQLTPEGKVVNRQIYTLDPFLSGDYTISPLQVRFRKKAEAASPQATTPDVASSDHEITTEEITIKVDSLLEKDQKNLALNPIRGPVALPAEPLSPWHILLGLGAAAAVAGGSVLLIRRRRTANRQSTAPALAAHELAYRQLQDILDEKLLERGELKLFFARISDVLRLYIENRFGLHAPKRTTEEFLADINRDAPFSAEHQTLLGEFLSHCDLVKFAEHRPAAVEIDKTIDACRAFIEATKAGPAGEVEVDHARSG
jgi:hypothetical protein